MSAMRLPLLSSASRPSRAAPRKRPKEQEKYANAVQLLSAWRLRNFAKNHCERVISSENYEQIHLVDVAALFIHPTFAI